MTTFTKNSIYAVLILCVGIFFPLQKGFAQQLQLTGKVLNEANQPQNGASVIIKNTKFATSTNENGEFSFANLNAGKYTIQVSYVGYKAQEKEVDLSSTTPSLSFNLVSDEGAIDEVVVVGYGTVKKKDVTGSVSNIESKDFVQGNLNNPMQQIAGKVPGVVITQPSGDPNQNVSIRLRGQTSLLGNQAPLIIVDNVQLADPGLISSINPLDIVTYDILKDASATSIYGSRGANGVIIITTKRGKAGKAEVNYSGSVGFDRLAKKWDLLNRDEYIAAGGKAENKASGDAVTITDGNTDWIDAITRTGLYHSHNAGISGGTSTFNYRGALNYLKQDGILLNSDKENYGINFNAQQKALDNKLTLNLGANINRTTRNQPPFFVFYTATQMAPNASVYDATGGYYKFKNEFDIYNPVPELETRLSRNVEKNDLWSGSVDYDLFQGLKIGAAGSMAFYSKKNDSHTPVMPVNTDPNNNSAGQSLENTTANRGELHAFYVKDFDKHNINATAVYEYNYFSRDGFNANANNLISDDILNNNLALGNPATRGIGSYKSEYKLISFLGRVMYNYDSRYYLTASLRRDGSSKFGINNQWGSFPSVSAAWRLKQESFMTEVDWLSELKIAAGWGRTGNSDAIDPYKTLLLLNGKGNFYDPTSSSYPYRQAFGPSQNGNPDLQWETREGFNLQLDFAILNNRISGNIQAFNDKTRNMLYNYTVPVPPFFVNTILANVGTLSNKGLEIQLNGDVVKKNDFNWNLGGQISFIRTKVESLSGTYAGYNLSTDLINSGYATGRGMSGVPLTYLKVGYSPYSFLLSHYVGLNDDGRELFDDGKGGTVLAGAVTQEMRKFIDPAPKFSYGINNNLSYKKLSLSFFLRGISGVKYYNNTRMILDNISNLQIGNVTRRGLESKSKDLTIVSDKWLENASFLRLENATLGYTFSKVSDKIENLRVFINGSNLFVISKYSGLDPEIQVASGGNSYIDRISADNAYYKSRSYSFGVNLTFK